MPELIVRKWDGPYSFMVFREYGVYKARRGDTGEVQFEDPSASVVIQQAANSLLHGGTIFLKEVQLPSGLTIPTNVLIVEDYQGVRSFYTSRDVYPPAVEPASYIVFKDGDLVKAKNGQTGEVEFSDSDAATVLQSAITAMNGGVLFIKEGTYEITGSIDLAGKQGITIEGVHGTHAGKSTLLKLADDANVPIFTKVESPALISRINIRNLYLHGNSANNPTTIDGLIKFVGVKHAAFENLRIADVNGDGIYLSTCEDIIISRCRISGTSKDGVEVGGSTNVIVSENTIYTNTDTSVYVRLSAGVKILGNNIDQSGGGLYGIFVYRAAETEDYNVIAENYIVGGSRTAGACVYIQNSNLNRVIVNSLLRGDRYGLVLDDADRNVILGNIIGNPSGYTDQDYGVYERDTSDYNQIELNHFINVTYPVTKVGSNTKVHRNIGYVTENSGTETGTGAQQTIAHGCDFTPTKAQVIVSNIDDGANPYLSADPDATNIYVTAVSGKAYRWEVKMCP